MSDIPYAGGQRAGIPTADELRARIPGWGADLDPADRPAVPRELPVDGAGAPGVLPPEQPERWPRERSIEHARLTPVFGATAPPRGVSGAIRRLAYRRYSEARAAHWLLLLAADRVESKSHAVRSMVSGRPDDPVTETGILGERRRHGIASRRAGHRTDVRHHPVDALLVGAPWVLTGGAAVAVLRRAVRAGRRRTS